MVDGARGRSALARIVVYPSAAHDFDRADLKLKLPASVTALNDLVESGETVYVHCTAGVSRSPTVVALAAVLV